MLRIRRESTSPFGALSGEAVPLEEFMKLTRISILIFYGGNIPEEVTEEWGRDNWRVRLKIARLCVETVNRHGGGKADSPVGSRH